MFRTLICAIVILGWCGVAIAADAPAAETATPPILKDWRPWVLKDLEYRACPFLANAAPAAPEAFLCAWPSRLTLNAAADGASFSVHWRVEAPGWVPLPGDAEHWPQQVSVNGQRQPVLARDAAPALWLPSGSYEIAARIPWSARPQSLRVPASIGLIALSVDGKTVIPVERDGEEITLGRGEVQEPEADALELRVFRKLRDELPAELTTRIELQVAGQAREESLGPALPEGFIALALDGGLPARLDSDGKLRVQVRPGNFTLTLNARAIAPLTKSSARLAPSPWPPQEFWSFEAVPDLRVANASSAVQVDPKQVGIPNEWQALPAFALKDGGALTIEERARGMAADEADRLSLTREAWLDFDGGGWFTKDRIGGRMLRGWRLDVGPPYTLERASSALPGRAGEGLLVTRGRSAGSTGVEWRSPQVALDAGLRLNATGGALPVAGWQHAFDAETQTLHFPFGYKLLAAPGADRADGSWISRWTLLDVFWVAVLTLLAWRLLGPGGASLAALYLVLGYQESDGPGWTLFMVLALALVKRVLPAGRLALAATWTQRAAFALLALAALPFVADQVRWAIYPQLEDTAIFAQPLRLLGGFGATRSMNANVAGRLRKDAGYAETDATTPMSAAETTTMNAPQAQGAPGMAAGLAAAPPRPLAKRAESKSQALEVVAVTGSRLKRADMSVENLYDQSVVVQTGAGEPSWNYGSSYRLSFSGPILPQQTLRLIVMPPWLTRLLRLVLVGVLIALLARLWRSGGATPRAQPVTAARTAASNAALVLATGAALTLGAASGARAQAIPTDELLDQLRTRLTEAPKCAPECAAIAQAQVSANGDEVRVALEAHAGERIALPLPGDDKALVVKSITVDGVVQDALARHDDKLWLALGRGVHRVELGFTAHDDKVALAFPLKPARVLFSGHGWEASGLSDERLLTESLSLVRARANAGASGAATASAQQFPPFVRVERNLTLGLDWKVDSAAERLAPKQGGFTVEVPLLAGEHVGSAGIKVKDNRALVAIADGEDQAEWSGTLDKSDSLTLTAPALGDRAEVWTLTVSPMWHAEFSGVPEDAPEANASGLQFRRFGFHPRPGETLAIKLTRPEAAPGATIAIDAVSMTTGAGQRAAEHALGFNLRSSQGGEHAIVLPANAQVLAVNKNGPVLNLRPREGKLSLPVTPGQQHFEVHWRETAEIGTLLRTATPALGAPAANIGIALSLPADRWVLFTFGPAIGPAVLYWGELVVMTLVAWALARTRRSPLRFRHWLLLGLGFSAFSWGALLLVAAWPLALDWRERRATITSAWRFDLLQVGLVVLTVVALLCIVNAIRYGMLGEPDLHLTGNGSMPTMLHWFADRSTDALPQAGAVTLPLWVYKVLMLAWALWLANALIGWMRWGFAAWSVGGYWKKFPPRAKPQVASAPESAAAAAPQPEPR